MKRFILKIFYFLFPIVISAFLLEIALRRIPNDYAYKKTYLDQNANQIETLILGSSHAYFGLDPIYYESKAFNAAYVSQTMDCDFEIFAKYNTHMSQLKTVIFALSYFSMFDRITQTGESWRIKNYFLYYDIDLGSMVFYKKNEILGQKFAVNMDRLFKYYVKKESLTTSSELGWGASYKSEDSKDLYITGKEAAKRHKSVIDPLMVSNYADLLDRLVGLCSQRNIQVVFITLPAFQSYRENLDSEQLDITFTIANDIAQKHENCSYINLLADTSFIDEDFYDGDHLNEIGTKKLSLMVNKIIEKIEE